MFKTMKNCLMKSGKKTLSLILSLAVIFSLAAPAAMAEVTVDDSGMKIALSYKPGCLQIDSNGKIYVGDWSNGYLYRYNADGSLDTSWGTSGKADGVSIRGTVGMCLDSTGNIIVTGQSTSTVYRVNKDTGAVVKSVSVSGPLGCNTDSDGNIYVAAHSGIYKYDSNFNLLKSTTLFMDVFGIAVNSDGKIYITTNHDNKVFRLNSDLSLDITFGSGGNVVVFNANYGDNLLIQGGKLYTSSEFDNACYSLNLDGTDVTKIISGTGPTQVFITGDSYAVPFWGAQYIQIFKRPNIDLKNDNFKFTMNPLKVTEGSNTPINFTIESTSTKNYTVKAQLINKLTGAVASGVSSTTATLQDGNATVTLTPPAGGWTKGIYSIQMIFSNTVGSITLSDTLEVGISMGVGYYAINYNTPSNGTISGKTEYVEINPDVQATFTVNPDSGYFLDKANTTVTNADVEFNENQGTVKNITGDVNVHVAFTDISSPTNITGVPASWTNQDQTISFSFDSDPASVTVVGSVSGNKAVTKSGSTYSFVATQNETYTVTVSNGTKTNSTDIDVAKIDKVTPVVSVSHTPEDLSKATENDVVFTLSNTASNASGVTYYVQKDSGEFTAVSGDTYTAAAPDSSTYKFKAVSGAGSESMVTSGYTINAIKPEYTPITVNTDSYSAGSWTSNDVTLSLSGGLDASTFEKYQYSTNNSDWSDVTGSSITVDSNFNGKYYFRVVAKSGSTGSATTGTEVKVDKNTDFTVAATGDTASICQNNTVAISTTGLGASGVAKVEVQKDNGSWTDITASYKDGYSVTSNGSYVFRVTNGVGVQVETASSLVYSKIDTAVPTASISANGYTEDTWTTGNVTIDITNGNSENLGTATYQYSADGGKTYVPFNGKLVVSDDTDTTYLFRVISQSGVESVPASFTVKRDATAPTGTVSIGKSTWKEFLHTITFGLFFKDIATVTVTGADETSSIQKVEYYQSDSALTLDEVKAITSWSTYDKAIAVSPVDAESFVYYVKLTDNAGNVQYISSDGVTFDTTAPTIDSITDGATYYVRQKVTVSDTNLDKITVNGIPLENGGILQGDTDATYVIIVTDKSGNSLTYTVYMKTLASICDGIQGIQADNVKITDKDAVEAVLATINNVISTTNNGATTEEIQALNSTKDSVTNILNTINLISKNIADIDTKTTGITTDNAKSSDKTNLNDALVLVNDLLKNKTGNLTDSEKTALEQKKTDIQNALSKIGEVATATQDVDTKTTGITTDNAKSSDKANLDDALTTVNDLLNNKTGNLTDSEKTALEQKKTDIQNALSKIGEVATATQDVDTKTTGITTDNAKSSDKANLDDALTTVNDLLNNKAGNLTGSEKTALQQKKTDIQNALYKISDVATVTQDVETKTTGITTDNAKSSDKANLDDALTTVNDLLNNKIGNLTDSEKTALEQKKTDIQDALAKIDTVTKKINDTIQSIESITLDNVKKTDQPVLKNALDDLNTILVDYSSNLTDDEKTHINDTIKAVKDTIGSLDQVQTVEDQIAKLPDADKVTKDDANTIGTASKAFDELSDHQETLVDSTLVTKLGDVKSALSKLLLEDSATGTKLEGVDGTTFDVNTELVVTPIKNSLDTNTQNLFAINVANAAGGKEIAQLYDIHLLLNGQKIQPDGRVKITLKLTDETKDFTDLQVVYIADNGDVTIIPCERHGDEIVFYTNHFSNYGIIGTPVKSADSNNANTGDMLPLLYFTMAGMALVLLVITAKKKRGNSINMK